MLFTMTNMHFYTKLLVNMFGKMLGGIYTAMLPAGASETEHQRGKATLHVAVYMMVGKCIDMFQELQYLTIILQKSDNRLIQTRQLFIRLVSARVMGTSTVEDITSAIARRIFRNSLAIRKTKHSYYQRSLTIIFRIGGCDQREQTEGVTPGQVNFAATAKGVPLGELALRSKD